MGKVFSALAVSVDGYITGRGPGPGRGLGDAPMLFDWCGDGDTPSQHFDGFRLVPVLLGGGRPYFHELPEHIRLRLVEVVPAPGVTHLHYAVER
jgi:hypothetical protein